MPVDGLRDGLTVVLVLCGCFFFLAGSVGVLRFPDVYSRLHALTKADNLGLGFVVLGVLFQAGDWTEILRLLLVWMLALGASVTVSHVIGRAGRDEGVPVWRARR